jgi:hypothetical protein
MRTIRIVAVAVVVTAICTLFQPTPAGAATTTARGILGALAVGREAGSTTYNRAAFPHWIDADGDCQDTRAEILIIESRAPVTYTTNSQCTVAGGRWLSPWDNRIWTVASDVDIDHHVPLKEAWESGARSWVSVNRQRFANDSYGYSLIAITDNLNASKGDRDAAQWLPPVASTRCAYATQWVLVKYRWKLSIDPTERAALSNILSGSCGNRVVTIPPRAR